MSHPEIVFTGKPTEIDLLAADAQFQFILHADDYETEPQKIAYFLSKCRGPALTWGARYLSDNPALKGSSYAAFLLHVKENFGYDDQQAGAIARAQLSSIRQTGSLIEFIASFDDACGRADIHGDQSKLTMLLDKLQPRYKQIIVDTGNIPESYARVRKRLLNISAMEGQSAHHEQVQGGKRKSQRKNRPGGAGPRIKIEAKN